MRQQQVSLSEIQLQATMTGAMPSEYDIIFAGGESIVNHVVVVTQCAVRRGNSMRSGWTSCRC